MSGARVRFTVLAASLVCLAGCDLWPFGPSRSVAGHWRFQEGRSGVFEMSLTQTDDRIAGTACVSLFGIPVRQDVPVRGDYPRLSLAVGDCRYDMRFEEDRDQIAGDCEGRRLVRFSRGGSGSCARASRSPQP